MDPRGGFTRMGLADGEVVEGVFKLKHVGYGLHLVHDEENDRWIPLEQVVFMEGVRP